MKPCEFQDLVQLAESKEPFPINLEQVWQWMGFPSKQTAKKKLIKFFIKGVDFFIKATDIFLTVECCKILAVFANTLKGEKLYTMLKKCENTDKTNTSPLVRKQKFQSKQSFNKQVLPDIVEHWGDSLTKIRMAVKLLQNPSIRIKEKYFEILSSSCNCLLDDFRQMIKLQELWQPENLHLLQQLNLFADGEVAKQKRGLILKNFGGFNEDQFAHLKKQPLLESYEASPIYQEVFKVAPSKSKYFDEKKVAYKPPGYKTEGLAVNQQLCLFAEE